MAYLSILTNCEVEAREAPFYPLGKPYVRLLNGGDIDCCFLTLTDSAPTCQTEVFYFLLGILQMYSSLSSACCRQF